MTILKSTSKLLDHKTFERYAKLILNSIQSDEELSISLSSEESCFTRFTKSKVRQVTDVFQSSVNIHYIKNNKATYMAMPLVTEDDANKIIENINENRKFINDLPDDPFLIHPTNHGTSFDESSNEFYDNDLIIEVIAQVTSEVDMAGMLASGVVVKANINSKGQFHWFKSRSFFLDYSLYNPNQKAVKGLYAGEHFEKDQLIENLKDSIEKLSLMNRASKKIEKGQYRVYLAPSAVSELMGTLSWGGLSEAYHQRGQGSLTDLWKKKRNLSPKFTLTEDFALGHSPRFNETGEVFVEKLSLIENGEFKNFFISSRTAKEFSVETNNSPEWEAPRSACIKTGQLKKSDILKRLDTGLYISDLHYLNWSDRDTARITGMTRYACFWVENGEIVAPIEDIRFDESYYTIFGDGLLDLTETAEVIPTTGTYFARDIGAMQMPGILVEGFKFTL